MQSIVFDAKFVVTLSKEGTSYHIDALADTPAVELAEFKRNFSKRMFERIVNLEQERKLPSDQRSKESGNLPADAQIEFKESIQLYDCKYEVGIDQDDHLVALRHGEPWRSCIGDNLMMALFQYARDAEAAQASVDRFTKLIDVYLNGDNAAEKPSLCDIACQLGSIYRGDDGMEASAAEGMPILDRLQFNRLTAAQAERLFLLLEERAESIHSVAKILRHGYNSYNPKEPTTGTNRQQLEREEGDGVAAMNLLCRAGDLDVRQITDHSIKKTDHVKQYLHHQGGV